MKTLMRNGRDRRSENPFLGHARKERVSLFGTDQRITSGPAATRLHSKAEYMTAPERFADSQIPLAPRAPSIHDPERTQRHFFSAIAGTDESASSITLPHERGCPLQPPRRIGPAARDAAITASIALQMGADPQTIRKALCRNASGKAVGPLGAAFDQLASEGPL
jgi:hypothetical protein